MFRLTVMVTIHNHSLNLANIWTTICLLFFSLSLSLFPPDLESIQDIALPAMFEPYSYRKLFYNIHITPQSLSDHPTIHHLTHLYSSFTKSLRIAHVLIQLVMPKIRLWSWKTTLKWPFHLRVPCIEIERRCSDTGR